MGLKNLEIIFDNPQRTFFGGQTVTGRLKVQNDAPKDLRSIVIKFKGEASVRWSETHRERRNGKTRTRSVGYSGQETYFENRTMVFGTGSGTQMLPPGEHYFPFSMVLPNRLPTSFEGLYGYIRYTVKATLDRPWKFDHEVKSVFTVVSHMDLNLDPLNREPMKIENLKYFCCCCCKSGPLTLVTIIPARGYVSGQHVPITVEVDNLSNVNVNGVVIELEQNIRYHATSPPKAKQQNVTVLKVALPGEVHEHGSRTWAQNFKLPPLPASQLRECRIIDLAYVLKVKANPQGMHINLTNDIPITIGTIPLWEGQPMQGVVRPISMPMPSAPPPDIERANPSAPYPNLPPPSYEECIFGTDSIGDADDNQHVFGITSYKPRYPTYDLRAPPPGYPGSEHK